VEFIKMLEITVRSTHVDVMGHVNNAKYVEYLEWGRCDEVEKAGVDLWQMVREGLGFAVVNLNIHYRREAVVGEVLVIETIFRELRNHKLGIVDQVIRKKNNGEIVCEAEVSFLIFDLQRRKSIPMPENIQALIKK